MKNFSFKRPFGNNSKNFASVSKNKRKRNRTLRIEELESREMLSADLFNAINTAYSDLDLGDDWERYNYIEIQADNLSDAAIRNAINTAGTTAKDDIIVVHTTDSQNKITLAGWELVVNIDESTYGSVTIVTLGDEKLTIDAYEQSRVFGVYESTLLIAGLTITGGHANNERDGGGVYNYLGSLTIIDCTISENTAVQNGGAIYNTGELRISNSVIAENTASASGGGIYNTDAGGLTVSTVH
jgi:predicted outer membrane repeat protein